MDVTNIPGNKSAQEAADFVAEKYDLVEPIASEPDPQEPHVRVEVRGFDSGHRLGIYAAMHRAW